MTPSDKPIIWTLSVSRLFDLFRDIMLEYADQAHVEPIHLGFEDAVKTLRERMKTERCDAIIAGGSNAAYLRSRLPVPIVTVKASGFDVMQALAKARKISPHIGIVTYQQTMSELTEFKSTFGFDVIQRTYTTEEDARTQINELRSAGIKVIVGAGLISDLTDEAGLTGVFLYSSNSIRQAFNDALEIVKYARIEAGPTLSSRDTLRARHDVEHLRGNSEVMQQIRYNIGLFAKSHASVLILGETGTGKELAAQAIHQASARARYPFVAVNCGAIAESLLEAELFGYQDSAFTGARRGGHAGLIETANRGTLFLDEIGEMPYVLQTRLLRVLEERQVVRVGATRPIPVDIRIISATHCNLIERIEKSQFRRDLYFRLAVLQLHLPPLRDRLADVTELTEWCLKNALAALGVTPHANLHAELLTCQNLLKSYSWPGNVRELRNVCERLALYMLAEPLQAFTPRLLMQIMPELTNTPSKIGMRNNDELVQTESEVISDARILETIARHRGNRAAAAKSLGMSRTTLWRKLNLLQPTAEQKFKN